MLFWLVIATLVLTGLLVMSAGDVTALSNLPPAAIAAAVLAVLLSLYLLATRATATREARRLRAGVTLAVGLLSVGLLGFAITRLDATRFLGVLANPPAADAALSDSLKSVIIRRNERGQFLARGEINGQPVDLLIDTGATSILLKASDATKAGIPSESLNYSVPISTANGQVYAAPVKLRAVSVGPVRMEAIEALVAQPGILNESLLGMSFLTRLRSYELKGNFITLRE